MGSDNNNENGFKSLEGRHYSYGKEKTKTMTVDDFRKKTYQYNSAAKEAIEPIHVFAAKTFGWVFLGALVTFLFAFFLSRNAGFKAAFLNAPKVMLYVPAIVLVVLTFIFSLFVFKVSPIVAKALYLVYALIEGVTLSLYFMYFDVPTICFVFLIGAGMFGIMAALSYFLKWELSGLGMILFVGLLAILLFTILNMIFFKMQIISLVICYIGLAIFLGYTAYDTSMLRNMYAYYASLDDDVMLKRCSIYGAFSLYLDFMAIIRYIFQILILSKSSD